MTDLPFPVSDARCYDSSSRRNRRARRRVQWTDHPTSVKDAPWQSHFFEDDGKTAPLPTIPSESGVVADDWDEELAGTTLKLRTMEGDVFEVLACVLKHSPVICGVLRDVAHEEEIPLPNVKSSGLKLFLDFCHMRGLQLWEDPVMSPKEILLQVQWVGKVLGMEHVLFDPLTMLVESDVARVFCHIPWHVLNRLLHALPDALSKTILLPVIQILSQVETEYQHSVGTILFPLTGHQEEEVRSTVVKCVLAFDLNLKFTLLRHRDRQVRVAAVSALPCPCLRAVPTLLGLASDTHSEVREFAVLALTTAAPAGDEDVIRKVAELLGDSVREVRSVAVKALRHVVGPQLAFTVDLLLEQLESHELPGRCATLRTLAELAPHQDSVIRDVAQQLLARASRSESGVGCTMARAEIMRILGQHDMRLTGGTSEAEGAAGCERRAGSDHSLPLASSHNGESTCCTSSSSSGQLNLERVTASRRSWADSTDDDDV